MIEATCAACGTLNRIAEADVPLGAKFVTCSSCKSRVALAAKTAMMPSVAKAPAVPRSKTPPPMPAIPKTATIDLADLPAPKRASPLAGTEPSKPAPRSALALDAELPAPKTGPRAPAATVTDTAMPVDLPAPKAKPVRAGLDDLPAPKPANPAGDDLLAPAAANAALDDLPAPKARPSAKPAVPPADLSGPRAKPAQAPPQTIPPKRSSQDIIDLPAPKVSTEIIDLPMPKADLTDLPMPKAGADSDQVAPKGFFDDLPQPARAKPGAAIDLPAPKGFFDDLPAPVPQDEPSAHPPKAGFFDDLPQPAQPAAFGEARGAPGDLDMDLSPSSGGSMPLELGDVGPELELGLGSSAAPRFEKPDEIEIPEPTAKGGIRIGTPKPAKGSGAPTAPAPSQPKDGELKLELEGELPRAGQAAAAARRPERRKQVAAQEPEVAARNRRRSRIVLGAVLGVAVVGAGGFFLYQRHVKAKTKADEIAIDLATTRAALIADDPTHWQRAETAAKAVLAFDETNADALGNGAEALLAGALDTGVNGPARIAQGRKLIQDALAAGVTGPALDRAQALNAIAANQPERAITKLEALAARQPNDGFLLLYLGWAELAHGDQSAAIKAFDRAIKATPAVKLAALYGRGRAKLLLADLAGARADFSAVIDASKDHLGAMIGLAATLPPAQTEQREKDLIAILEGRKDVATGDPRALVQAWTLAADVARQGGRLDVARERYRKALGLIPLDTAALTGLASVELRDGKPEVADDLIQKALASAADNPDAQLVAAELWIKQGKLPDAQAAAKKLAARTPPLTPLQQAHLDVVVGKILEVQGQDDAAVDAYVAGAKIAGELDLTPTIAAVTKLAALAKHATELRDDKSAAAYRGRADELLSALADRAKDDAQLAMTLGVAYLDAGDAAKAETFLRRTVEMRGEDIEAKVELAKALARLGRAEDAIAMLDAAAALDKTRSDIALELARTYEAAGRTAETVAAYDRLLAAKDITVAARVHAGRYFARTGDLKRAGAQAEPILAADPDNAAGHYLKGEVLLAAGKLDDARKELNTAVDRDPEAQYLDAQGRAAEASIAIDTKYQETALHAYQRASEAAPTLLNPLAGQGRVYVMRKEWSKAIPPLLAANKLDPNNADVMFEMGVALQAIQDKPKATQWLSRATKLKPDHAEAWYRLGQLYEDTDNAHDAATAYERSTRLGAAQEQNGKPVDWLTDAYYQLGNTDLLPAINNTCGAKAAWEKFIARPGADPERVKLIKQQLLTSLAHC